MGMSPKISYRPTAASPADAMQPHSLQSGAPPNWHGVMRVVRAAAIVGRGCAADVVLGLQSVDRDDDRELRQSAPGNRDLANRARHELHPDAALREHRQNRVELAVPDERLAADDRQMQRAKTIDEG